MPVTTKKNVFRALALALLTICLGLVWAPLSTHAAKTHKSISANTSKIKQLKKKLAELGHKKKAISSEINQIDRVIYVANRDLGKTILDLNRNRVQHTSLKRQLDDTIARYTSFRSQYKDRLIAFYKNGQAGYLEVLFNSVDFGDFISRMYYLRAIAVHDIGVMDELRDLRRQVQVKKAAVEETVKRIETLKVSIQQKKAEAQDAYGVKKKMLQKINSDANLTARAIAELEAENQQIAAELAAAKRRGNAVNLPAFSGSMGNPLCGKPVRITSSFGYRSRPTRGASSNHRGVDIDTYYGQAICSVADGVVFTAGWRRGYGLTVIIQHGSDLATVYGHGARVLVSAGQTVRRGEVVMLSDSTGISTGNHLHFEVRRNGAAMNPLGFISR